MAVSSQENEFLETAVAAIPKIAELIAALPSEDRAGALEVAERRFVRTAEEFDCAESGSRNWTAAVIRILRERVEELVSVKQKLERLQEELAVENAGPRTVRWLWKRKRAGP